MEFQTIADEIEELLRRLDEVDVRVPEDSALLSLAADLIDPIILLLGDGIHLLEMVDERYESLREEEPPEDDDPFSLKAIGYLIASELVARDLLDMVFFARSELRASQETMEMQGATLEAKAAGAETAIRRLRKALISVESSVYEFEHQKAPPREWHDLSVSLQIRKLYWMLRQEISQDPGDDTQGIAGRLRATVYRLVAFRERSVYPLLRIDDRIQIRRLSKRILEWINSSERDAKSGWELWQDVRAFAGVLVQINYRQELQEHDRELIKIAYNRLFRRLPMPDRIPDNLIEQFDSLLGLDDDLDRLIVGRVLEPVEAWREPLIHVEEHLNQMQEPVGSVDLLTDEDVA